MNIDQADFDFFVKFLQENSGYSLLPEKKYLLEVRLEDVLKTWKLSDCKDLVREVARDPRSKIAHDVIEAMTINETFFFRDQSPFEIFEQHVLGALAERCKGRAVKIWSSACSTGQEPYSIAMIIEENLHRFPGLSYEVVGTDINNRVLAKARQGIYSDLEVNRGLPDRYREKYFAREGSGWQIAPKVARHVQFQQLNLRENFSLSDVYDFVLLRNVLIYFDAPTKEAVLQKISQKMRPGANLMLGAAEAIYDPNHYFQKCSNLRGLFEYKPR